MARDLRRNLVRLASGVRVGVPLPRSSILDPRSLLAVAYMSAFAALPAFAADYPKLESGLWEMQRSAGHPDAQANRATMCLDDAVQKELFDMAGAMQGACSRHEFVFSGNRGRGDFVCSMGGSTMHSKSTMVVEGRRAYRTEIDTTYDPPLMGQARSRMVITARRVGACKPGQRPGDLVLPNGQTMNMHDVLAGARNAQRQGVFGTIQPRARKPAPAAQE
jgi:hypothetical protein